MSAHKYAVVVMRTCRSLRPLRKVAVGMWGDNND